MIMKVEESTDGSSPLNQGEARDLVEILEKVRVFRKTPLSALNPRQSCPIFRGSRYRLDRFFKILRQVYHSHDILPTSYYAHKVVLVENCPLGRFADIHKGECAGQSVCARALGCRLELIKRIRNLVISEESNSDTLPNGGSPMKLYGGNTSRIRLQDLADLPPFCIIGPWMPNSNVVGYTEQNQGAGRLLLVSVEDM